MIELSTQTWGSGDRSILLLHGITSNAEGWWRVGPALAELGFRVIAPDLRGHGLSHHSQDYRLSSHANDVLRLGDHWDAVIGHSMGGSVALEAYSPGWADRVILEDPAYVLAAEDADLILRGFSVEATPAAVREANPGWDQGDVIAKTLALSQMDLQMGRLTWDQNPDWDYRSELAGFVVPTLLMAADPDKGTIVTRAQGEAAASLNPNVRFAVVEGASHSIHRDSYDAFMELVEDFLGV